MCLPRSVFQLVFYASVCLAVDQSKEKLFTLQCTKFPLWLQSSHSENDSALVCKYVWFIAYDIGTLISSLVIVEPLWTERLNNERESGSWGATCVAVCTWKRQLISVYVPRQFFRWILELKLCLEMHQTWKYTRRDPHRPAKEDCDSF